MDQQDINIVGAGPSGFAAAIVLAKAGKNVIIHEKHDVVGKRFQGDLQGLENWSTKEDVLEIFQSFGINTNFHKTPFKQVTFTDGKRSPSSSSSEPLFYLVKRGTSQDTLDTALCKQAEECGVNIKYYSRYPLEKADIIATGPMRTSTVAMDKGLVFSTDHPDIAVGIFGDELAHLGYSYLLVTQGYGCICTVVFKDFQTLNPCFEKTLEFIKKRYGIHVDQKIPVGGLGSFTYNHPAQLGSARLVGEAAGLQDLLWGFGIRTAITSGFLAAQSILHQTDYPSMLKKQLDSGQKAGLVNRYIWEKMKYNSYPFLPYFAYLPISIRTLFRLLYQFSPIHRLLFPYAIDYIKQEYPFCLEQENE